MLHYFEQIQKHFPRMRNSYCRERGEFVLEEDKDQESYRWATVEIRRVCSGHVNPSSVQDAFRLHERVLEIAPYALPASRLDCESLNVLFGFDFTYRGNHKQLLVDALGEIPAFEPVLGRSGAVVVSHEPALQPAVDGDCRTQYGDEGHSLAAGREVVLQTMLSTPGDGRATDNRVK